MVLVVIFSVGFQWFLLLLSDRIGPPGVRLDLSDTLLHIFIYPPEGAENELVRDSYDLSYRILYWKNSSDKEVWTN